MDSEICFFFLFGNVPAVFQETYFFVSMSDEERIRETFDIDSDDELTNEHYYMAAREGIIHPLSDDSPISDDSPKPKKKQRKQKR